MLEGAGNCDFAIKGAKTEADDSKLKGLVQSQILSSCHR